MNFFYPNNIYKCHLLSKKILPISNIFLDIAFVINVHVVFVNVLINYMKTMGLNLEELKYLNISKIIIKNRKINTFKK